MTTGVKIGGKKDAVIIEIKLLHIYKCATLYYRLILLSLRRKLSSTI